MLQARILIADDDPALCDLFQRAILAVEPSWSVEVARDGREALEMLCKGRFDVAVLDLVMPHLNGIEVLEAIRQQGIQTDVIILTGFGTIERAVEAMKAGAREFIPKTIQPLDLIPIIRRALEDRCRRALAQDLPPHALADWLDAYLKYHAFERPLKFSDLCGHFGISSSYAARLFQEHIGEPYHTRLASYRVQKARRLLETSDDLLYQIADQCGFRNYRQLTKAFYKQEGVLPRTYRKICREKRPK